MDYTNGLVLKNGKTVNGLVVSQKFGKNPKNQTITMLKEDGSKESYPMNDVEAIRTEYKKKDRVIYAKNEMYVNEFWIKNVRSYKEGDVTAIFEKKVFPFPEGIRITFKSRSHGFPGKWKLVPLTEVKLKDGTKTLGYTATELSTDAIPPTDTDDLSTVGIISFGYLSPGFYALVAEGEKNKYLIKIIK